MTSTFEIREALKKLAQAHHKKHANNMLRAFCCCGAPSGGPTGSPGCKRFAAADSAIINFEAEISRYNDEEKTVEEPIVTPENITME